MPAAIAEYGSTRELPTARTALVEQFCSWSALDDRVGLVLAGHLEQHCQEVAGIAEVVVRVDQRQTAQVTVGEGGERRQLADQAPGLEPARLQVFDVLGVGVERRHGADRAHQHAHRMRVVAEAIHELLDVLVHHRVHGDVVRPHREPLLVGQLPFDDQVGGFEIGAVLGKLRDVVAAVAQDPLVAVDEGNLALARRGVEQGWIVSHQPEVVLGNLDLAELRRVNRAVLDRQLVFLARAIVDDGQGIFGHAPLLAIEPACHRKRRAVSPPAPRTRPMPVSGFQANQNDTTPPAPRQCGER